MKILLQEREQENREQENQGKNILLA